MNGMDGMDEQNEWKYREINQNKYETSENQKIRKSQYLNVKYSKKVSLNYLNNLNNFNENLNKIFKFSFITFHQIKINQNKLFNQFLIIESIHRN